MRAQNSFNIKRNYFGKCNSWNSNNLVNFNRISISILYFLHDFLCLFFGVRYILLLNISGLNGRQILRAISLSYPGFNLIQPNTYNIIPPTRAKEIWREHFVFLWWIFIFQLTIALGASPCLHKTFIQFWNLLSPIWVWTFKIFMNNNKTEETHTWWFWCIKWLSRIVYGCFQHKCVDSFYQVNLKIFV